MAFEYGGDFMPKTLHVMTVGVSVITNFARDHQVNVTEVPRHGQELYAFIQKNPSHASAELNAFMLRVGKVKKLSGTEVLLVFSDLPAGGLAAKSIGKYLFTKHQIQTTYLKLKYLSVPAGKGINSDNQQERDDVQAKAVSGLRQFRDKVEDFVKNWQRRNPEGEVAFNATGGYKAEVAVLYELGRFLRMPVYYLHETYKTTIELP